LHIFGPELIGGEIYEKWI